MRNPMAKTYFVVASDFLGKIAQVHASHGKLIYLPGLRATVMA